MAHSHSKFHVHPDFSSLATHNTFPKWRGRICPYHACICTIIGCSNGLCATSSGNWAGILFCGTYSVIFATVFCTTHPRGMHTGEGHKLPIHIMKSLPFEDGFSVIYVVAEYCQAIKGHHHEGDRVGGPSICRVHPNCSRMRVLPERLANCIVACCHVPLPVFVLLNMTLQPRVSQFCWSAAFVPSILCFQQADMYKCMYFLSSVGARRSARCSWESWNEGNAIMSNL